ncbi:MAG: hypothetical protein WAW37_03035 [Syntrophobacteraceae bacterium]
MPRDVRILFIMRMPRLFAYGALSVILILYLALIGLSDTRIGLLLTLTLLGDTLISLWLTTRADCGGNPVFWFAQRTEKMLDSRPEAPRE